MTRITALFVAALVVALFFPTSALAGAPGSTRVVHSLPGEDVLVERVDICPEATPVAICFVQMCRQASEAEVGKCATADLKTAKESLELDRVTLEKAWRAADAAERKKIEARIAKIDQALADLRSEVAYLEYNLGLALIGVAVLAEENAALRSEHDLLVGEMEQRWEMQYAIDQAQNEAIGRVSESARENAEAIAVLDERATRATGERKAMAGAILNNTEDIATHDAAIRDTNARVARVEGALNNRQFYLVAGLDLSPRIAGAASDAPFTTELVKGETLEVGSTDAVPFVGIGYGGKRFRSEAMAGYVRSVSGPMSGFRGQLRFGGVLDARERFTLGFGALIDSLKWKPSGAFHKANLTNLGGIAYLDVAVVRDASGSFEGQVGVYAGGVATKWTQGEREADVYGSAVLGLTLRLKVRVTARTNTPSLY